VLLTGFNSFVHDLKLGRQEMLSWPSKDGLQPNGVVTYPPDFYPEKKYPLVLYIHGGPTASSLLGFNALPQALAAIGWIVFEPNYRGSNNLGNVFQSAIAHDPSEGPGHDVITGVNVLKSLAYVDNSQVVVSGWSYGGWMSAWLIGRYPETWKAAVVGAAPVDFTDMYSLNDLNRMKRHAIVESPYASENNLEWAYKNSPIWHFSKIKAPTLIMSKTADARVTVTGSYKLFGALRDNNIETKFIAYPGPDHFPADPVRALDVYERWIGWIEAHVKEGNKIEVVREK
jgi:dipeptidyl aminopeptidase/acylaminoacyl peptidase